MNKKLVPKKRSLFNSIKKPVIYLIVVILLLVIEVNYGLIYFIHNEKIYSGNLTSSYLSIDITSDGSIILNDALPLTDAEGLSSENFEVLNIQNTSNIPVTLSLNLLEDENSTIDKEDIRYGIYVNNNLHNVDYVPNDGNLYTGTLLETEKIELKTYMWLDYNYSKSGTYFKGNFDIENKPSDMLGIEYLKAQNLIKIGIDGNITTSNDTKDIREYRFSGLNPNNYVWFNCNNKTTSDSSNCELWRILGIENVKATTRSNSYDRIKIVKEDNIKTANFGTSSDYNTSTIKTYLNETYYNSLKDSSKSMIIDALFNIGDTSITSNASKSYTNEILTKNQNKVGLLSLSDFGYSSTDLTSNLNNATLYSNSWLKNKNYYFINASSTNNIINNGTSITTTSYSTSSGIKPVVYLHPLVKIIGGNGSINAPYELSIDRNEISHHGDRNVLGLITFNMNGLDIEAIPPISVYADNNNFTIPNIEDIDGWSTTKNGNVEYRAGDIITVTDDITLYAIKKYNVMGNFSNTIINDYKNNITEIYFINDSQSVIDSAYNTATIKCDITYTKQFGEEEPLKSMNSFGNVLCWLEPIAGTSNYKLYIGSNGQIYLGSGYELFKNFSKVTMIDMENVKTDFLNTMRGMFENCSKLENLYIYNWDTKRVTDMNSMFRSCNSLTAVDVSGFDTSNVTLMYDMFYDCVELSYLDVSKWNTSNVENMDSLFCFCSKLNNIDVSKWITSKVTNMNSMFNSCLSLTSIDVTNFNTSNVIEMFYMFADCEELTTLDLSSFDTGKVTNMQGMFYANINLETIYIGNNWNTASVTISTNIFFDCTSIVGGNGTTYKGASFSYAHVDIDGNPGYLTLKTV